MELGANVDLPLWLAQELYSRQAAFIKLPYFFSDRSAVVAHFLNCSVCLRVGELVAPDSNDGCSSSSAVDSKSDFLMVFWGFSV